MELIFQRKHCYLYWNINPGPLVFHVRHVNNYAIQIQVPGQVKTALKHEVQDKISSDKTNFLLKY